LPQFTSGKNVTPEEKILERFKDLFKTTDDIRSFFYEILPKSSIIRSIAKFDEIKTKDEKCQLLVDYLGVNFFIDVPKITKEIEKKSPNEIPGPIPAHLEQFAIKREWNEEEKDWLFSFPKDVSTKESDELTTYIDKNFQRLCPDNVDLNDKEIITYFNCKITTNSITISRDPINLVRIKILELHAKSINKENPHLELNKLVKKFNEINNYEENQLEALFEIAFDENFTKKNWINYLLGELNLPRTVFETPPKEPPPPDTKILKGRYPFSGLYDYQMESQGKINDLFNNTGGSEERQQRLLLVLPTGAGKTRTAVQAIIEWLNARELNTLPKSVRPQQNNPDGIIFWLASSNELCTQASDTFDNIFQQIGTAKQINLTNLFGSGRKHIFHTLSENPGIHIVVTNLEHFEKFFVDESKFRNDRYMNYLENEFWIELRNRTIAIIIDEAHQVTSDSYKKFLAGMGFDFNRNKRGKDVKIYNTKNIVLIGLTATPFKGSGLYDGNFQPQEYDFDDKEHNIPEYMKKSFYSELDQNTKRIHRTFYGAYLPSPHKKISDSMPTAVINVPNIAYQGESIKISGNLSFDDYSTELQYDWKIEQLNEDPIIKSEPDFNWTPKNASRYLVTLTVTNSRGNTNSTKKTINVLSEKDRITLNPFKLEDFMNILTDDQKILCPVFHAEIDSKLTKNIDDFSEIDKKAWERGKPKEDLLSNNVSYNEKICEIVDKCIKKHNRKKILIFANSVKHSQELKIIFKMKYHHKSESVHGETNPGIRRQIIKKFKDKDSDLKILCNYAVLTAGFDAPLIDTILICRDVGNNSLITQMIGRGRRGPRAGGTDDLWLFTNKQIYLKYENGKYKPILLGWEQDAKYFKKLTEEQKKDLGVQDFDNRQLRANENDPKSESIQYIVESEPIDKLQLFCESCHQKSAELESSLKLWGFKNDDVTLKKFQDGFNVYRKRGLSENEAIGMLLRDSLTKSPCHTCKLCRVNEHIEKETSCIMTKFLIKHFRDPILVALLDTIRSIQDKKLNKIHWSDLKTHFEEINDGNKISTPLNISSSQIRELENHKLLQISQTLDVVIWKITDPSNFNKAFDNISKYPDMEKKLKKNHN